MRDFSTSLYVYSYYGIGSIERTLSDVRSSPSCFPRSPSNICGERLCWPFYDNNQLCFKTFVQTYYPKGLLVNNFLSLVLYILIINNAIMMLKGRQTKMF